MAQPKHKGAKTLTAENKSMLVLTLYLYLKKSKIIINIFYQIEISVVWVWEFKVESVIRNIIHSDYLNIIDLGSLKKVLCWT